MDNDHKVILAALSVLLTIVSSLIAYNVWERKQAAQLYRECLEIRKQEVDADPRSTNWCYLK